MSVFVSLSAPDEGAADAFFFSSEPATVDVSGAAVACAGAQQREIGVVRQQAEQDLERQSRAGRQIDRRLSPRFC